LGAKIPIPNGFTAFVFQVGYLNHWGESSSLSGVTEKKAVTDNGTVFLYCALDTFDCADLTKLQTTNIRKTLILRIKKDSYRANFPGEIGDFHRAFGNFHTVFSDDIL
jgi:hypothetical protein